MRKCDELADPNSCLNRAADDEPIFVLRAHDVLAPGIVRLWIEQVRIEWRTLLPLLTPELRAKLTEALVCANLMESWPDRKLPG